VLGWERKPGFKGEAGLAKREFDQDGHFTADTTELATRNGHKRVVFIGDSNTFGFGAPTSESFVKVVEHHLDGVDAINLGAMGYTSYQGSLVVARELPAIKPELLVVSFNVNDRRYAQGEGGQDSPATFRRLYMEHHGAAATGASISDSLYVWRATRSVLRLAGVVAPPAEASVDVGRLVPRVSPDSYRENLRRIVATARENNVAVMFLVLRDSPLQSAPVRAGITALKHGDVDSSILQFQQAVQGPAMFSALGRLYLSEALAAKGDGARSAQVRKTRVRYDSFRGGLLVRLDTEYNDIMRAVAHETGSELIEGADVLEQEPFDFIDNCHFDINGHRRLAAALAQRISTTLGVELSDKPEIHASR
jgi:lysophospholipase L1-like esterase